MEGRASLKANYKKVIVIALLELIYLYFPPSFHLTVGFLSCRPFVVITTFSTGFVGVEVTSVSYCHVMTNSFHSQ